MRNDWLTVIKRPVALGCFEISLDQHILYKRLFDGCAPIVVVLRKSLTFLVVTVLAATLTRGKSHRQSESYAYNCHFGFIHAAENGKKCHTHTVK